MALRALKPNFRALLAGLATPNQQGGIFGGFQAGLGGALNAGALEEQQQRAALQAQIEQQLKERQVGAQETSARADLLRAKAGPEKSVEQQVYDWLTRPLEQGGGGLSAGEAYERMHPHGGQNQGPEYGTGTGVAPPDFLGPIPQDMIRPNEVPQGLTPREMPQYRRSRAEALGNESVPKHYKPEAAPKEPKVPEFVAKQVRLINQMDPMDEKDFGVLLGVVKNPPTKEEGDAARAKLMKRIKIQSRPQPLHQ